MPACEDADPANLVGEWIISRDITDFRARISGTFQGRLVVVADTDGYAWAESGTLQWRDRTSLATRNLRLQHLEAGWWMAFADGRPFHPWRPNSEVVHRCGQDIYTGIVGHRLAAPNQIGITWNVTGPDKHYRLDSRYRRLS